MSDRIDDLGREAAAAVRDETADLELDRGLDDVMRRSRRRRAAVPLVGLVLVGLIAIPAVGWLLDGSDGPQFEVADAPPVTDDEADVSDDDVDATADDEPDTATPPEDEGGAGAADEGDGGEEAEAPTPEVGTDEPGEAVDATVSDGPRPLGTFALDEVATDGFPAGGEGVAYLTDVRVAGQDGFDRIVLEFTGDEIGPYRVGYIDPPVVQDGSGAEVDVAGGAFLEILLTAATGVEFDADAAEGYRLTYDGPERVAGDTGTVTELVRTGDFEATLTWTAGLEERAPFAVTVLESPRRLVVDVRTD